MLAAVLAAPPTGLMPPAAAADIGSISGAYLAGRFALSQGDLARAAEGLGRALERTPEDAGLAHQVMLLEAASGDLSAAGARAADLAGSDEVNTAAGAQLILAVEALRRSDPAATALLEGLGDDTLPGLVAPLLRAWAEPLPANGAVILDTEESRLGELAVLHRAMLLDAADQPDAAVAALAALAREPQQMSDRVLATQVRLLARLGEAEAADAILRLGRPDLQASPLLAQAAEALERGEVPPPIFDGRRAGMADTLVAFADVLRAQRRPLHATVCTRLGLHLAPDYAPGSLMLARLLGEQEGPAAAMTALAGIEPTSPWWRQAQLELADAQAEAGDLDGSVAVLERLVQTYDDDPQPAVALGDVLRRAERFDAAANAYGTAVARASALGEPSWRLHYAQGIALERSKRWPEAEAALQRALALEPNQPFVLNYLGYSWVDQGQYLDEAKAMLYRAVELRPDDGFIVDSLGWAYYRLGDYDKAVTHLERAVELEPGDPVINDHLGDALWHVGREREARFQWRRALTLDPEPDLVPTIEVKLRDGLAAEDAG